MSPDQLIYAIAQEGRLYDADTGLSVLRCTRFHIQQWFLVNHLSFFSATGFRSCLTASFGLLSPSYQYQLFLGVLLGVAGGKLEFTTKFCFLSFVSALYIIWSSF